MQTNKQTNKQLNTVLVYLVKWFVDIQAGNIKITMSPPHFKRLYNNSKYLTCLMALQIPGGFFKNLN